MRTDFAAGPDCTDPIEALPLKQPEGNYYHWMGTIYKGLWDRKGLYLDGNISTFCPQQPRIHKSNASFTR